MLKSTQTIPLIFQRIPRSYTIASPSLHYLRSDKILWIGKIKFTWKTFPGDPVQMFSPFSRKGVGGMRYPSPLHRSTNGRGRKSLAKFRRSFANSFSANIKINQLYFWGWVYIWNTIVNATSSIIMLTRLFRMAESFLCKYAISFLVRLCMMSRTDATS